MALRGNLKELSLPDIFQLVTFSGKTGVLRIQRTDGAKGSVWFRDGDVFFASSNWHADPLGQRLVRAQRITPMALDRALELRAAEPQGGKRLGEILVEQGYITDKVLEAFVQEQMQDTIFDLMRWDEGDFEFEAMPEAPEEDIGLAVSIENVIMEGSRRLEEWNRIKKKIPSSDVVFKMATAPGEGTFEISLKPIEWNLLVLIDGSRSIAELAEATSRTDFEVARIVYGLFSAGLLEFATEDEVSSARTERTEREARFATFEAEKAAQLAAEEASRPQPEPEPTVSDKPGETIPAAQAGVITAPSEPAEMPEFLGVESRAGGADSEALEAAMDALLSAPPAPVQAAEAPSAAPYTPGEEPAFIAASYESAGTGQAMSVPSVEDLLPDMTGLTPTAAEEPEATIPELEPSAPGPETAETETAVVEREPEPATKPGPPTQEHVEVEPQQEPELEPQAEIGPEPAVEPALMIEPEPAPEPEPEPQPEPAMPMPATTPLEAFEFLPVSAPLDEPPAEPAWQPPSGSQQMAPGSYVVVPASGPETAPEVVAHEPMHWEPPQIDFDDEIVAPGPPFDLPMVPVTAPSADTDLVAPLRADTPAQTETPAIHVPEVVPEPVAETPAAPESPPPIEPSVAVEPPAALEIPVATGVEVPEVQPPRSSAVPGLQNFEHDLMALGLGELPAELRAPEPFDDSLDLEPIVEPMGVSSGDSAPAAAVVDLQLEPEAPQPTRMPEPDLAAMTVEEPHIETEAADDGGADFSALLQSLDISADDAEAAVPVAVETGPELEFVRDPVLEIETEVVSAGVISTDAFLEDLSLEDEFTFTGELTDELSALTGADRPSRPAVSVNKLPDAGEPVLRRDSRVDRETLLKIIQGIENL